MRFACTSKPRPARWATSKAVSVSCKISSASALGAQSASILRSAHEEPARVTVEAQERSAQVFTETQQRSASHLIEAQERATALITEAENTANQIDHDARLAA